MTRLFTRMFLALTMSSSGSDMQPLEPFIASSSEAASEGMSLPGTLFQGGVEGGRALLALLSSSSNQETKTPLTILTPSLYMLIMAALHG